MCKPYGKFKTLWQYIMWRDKRICQIRHRPVCIETATQVDHIVAVWRYGRSTPDNLQAACAPCNTWKGIKILAEQASSKRMQAFIDILLIMSVFLLFVVLNLLHLRL